MNPVNSVNTQIIENTESRSVFDQITSFYKFLSGVNSKILANAISRGRSSFTLSNTKDMKMAKVYTIYSFKKKSAVAFQLLVRSLALLLPVSLRAAAVDDTRFEFNGKLRGLTYFTQAMIRHAEVQDKPAFEYALQALQETQALLADSRYGMGNLRTIFATQKMVLAFENKNPFFQFSLPEVLKTRYQEIYPYIAQIEKDRGLAELEKNPLLADLLTQLELKFRNFSNSDWVTVRCDSTQSSVLPPRQLRLMIVQAEVQAEVRGQTLEVLSKSVLPTIRQVKNFLECELNSMPKEPYFLEILQSLATAELIETLFIGKGVPKP